MRSAVAGAAHEGRHRAERLAEGVGTGGRAFVAANKQPPHGFRDRDEPTRAIAGAHSEDGHTLHVSLPP